MTGLRLCMIVPEQSLEHMVSPLSTNIELAAHNLAAGLTAEDVLYLRPKFWALHTDLIAPLDGAATTLITIQYNLAAGTLAPHIQASPFR